MTGRQRVLVINADDFGLTPGVSEGILKAHREGVVTSTSALVVAPAFESTGHSLRDQGLPTGIHLCAVGEDRPLLDPDRIPSLVDDDGRFPMSWRGFVRRAAVGRVRKEHLRLEFDAQLRRLLEHGIRPTHVDTHQNLHLWPQVCAVVLELAALHDIPLIRIPRSHTWGAVPLAVGTLGHVAGARARRSGLAVPGSADGLDDAGSMQLAEILAALDRLRGVGSAADLTVHPGTGSDPDRDRYRWNYSWPEELDALCSPHLPHEIHRRGFRLGSFADLASTGSQRRNP